MPENINKWDIVYLYFNSDIIVKVSSDKIIYFKSNLKIIKISHLQILFLIEKHVNKKYE